MVGIPIRVAVIEDEQLVREGLVRILESNSDIVCPIAVSNITTALAESEVRPPDVAFLDVTIPDQIGFNAARLWRARLPNVPLLLIDDCVHDVNLRAALKLGACGYVTKTDRLDDIVNGIRACAVGSVYFTHKVRDRIQRTDRGWLLVTSAEPGAHLLTARETEVLALVVQGLSVKDCSERLGISASTIGNHKARLMKKLNLHKTVDLARFALREGLMSL